MNEERKLPARLEERAKAMLNATTSIGWNWDMVRPEWRDYYRREAQIEDNYKNWKAD